MEVSANQSSRSAVARNGIGSSNKKIQFVDLVFDTILLEKATTSRSGKREEEPQRAEYVQVTFGELAKDLDLAQQTCRIYNDGHPKHHQSANMATQLAQASLNVEDTLRRYVYSIGGCNGFVLPRPGQNDREFVSSFATQEQSALKIVLPKDGESTAMDMMVPILDAAHIKRFESKYAEAEAGHQDMIARIIYSLRTQLWGMAIPQSNMDVVVKNAIFQYGSRYIQRKTDRLTLKAQRAGGRHEGEGAGAMTAEEHLKAIEQQLQGLQIIQDQKKITYGLQGQLDLPVVMPTSDAYGKISTSMIELYQRLVPSQDYMSRREKLIKKLQAILDSNFPRDALRLEVFGSYASGLGSELSDADLCITTPIFQKTQSYNNMRVLANVLRKGGMTQVKAITDARVPIVKFVDPNSKINCDINTNHVLGIHNSELIRCYTLIDDRVRPFLYNLKALVKKHHINDSSQAWLSSYAYEPPVLPVLQAQAPEHMTPLHIQMNHDGRGGKDVIDCTYDRDYTRHLNFGAANTKSVGRLLLEFFEFYSRYYDYQTMEVNVRVGGGFKVRDAKTAGDNKRSLQRGKGEKKLVVMDPFIRDRNVAGSCSGWHLVRVWRIFETLYLRLSRGEFQRAFEVISEYHPEQQQLLQVGDKASIVATVAHAATARPREKKTERKLERKKEQQQKPAVTATAAGSPREPTRTVVKGAEPRRSETTSVVPTSGLVHKKAPTKPFSAGAATNTPATTAKLQPSRKVEQSGLIQELSNQKNHNDQLDKSRAKSNNSRALANPAPVSGSGGKQKPQQSAFPVLAKTQKILLTQSKGGETGGSTGGSNNGKNDSNSPVKSNQPPRARDSNAPKAS
ncbi:hypothetical protein BGZ58_000829 [Dissophora ornata]|nr:hypothetical protein BGZ58_000829 [Dissophora ornata]